MIKEHINTECVCWGREIQETERKSNKKYQAMFGNLWHLWHLAPFKKFVTCDFFFLNLSKDSLSRDMILYSYFCVLFLYEDTKICLL